MLSKLKTMLLLCFSFYFSQVTAAATPQTSNFKISFNHIQSISKMVSQPQCEALLQTFILNSEARSKLRAHPIVISPFNSILSLHHAFSSTQTKPTDDKNRQWQGLSKISLDQGKTFVEVPFTATENKITKSGEILIPPYCQANFTVHNIL